MSNLSNVISLSLMGAAMLCIYPNVSDAKDISRVEYNRLEHRVNVLEKRVSLLENDQTTYGPITVSHIRLNDSKHFTIVHPGDIIECSFEYQLDSSKQDFLSKNHLIVGLKGVAAEDCATHLYGVWDSHGTANFKLTAPLQAGDYEVRIAYRPGKTCQEALNTWTVLHNEPGNFATIGFLRVVR
jgi:hypothetical protein